MKVIVTIPQNNRFTWETYTFLDNMRTNGLASSTIVMIFVEHFNLDKPKPPLMEKMIKDFPEVEFFFYEDKEDFSKLTRIFNYIPLIRPKILMEYWKLHPEMEKETFFYTDTDVLFTQKPDFSPFLEDDTIYMSDAKGYTNIDYFDSKASVKDGVPEFVKPNLYKEFKDRDIPNELANICGINRAILEENRNSSGAAQYLIKNVNSQFWEDVMSTCMIMKVHINNANQQFMIGNTVQERENNGYQAWCVDIWAVNWQLLKRGRKIETPSYFDFLWTTDSIEDLSKKIIYHNAGITSSEKLKRKVDKEIIDCPVFFKGDSRYVNEESPFNYVDDLQEVINHPISSTFCVSWYCQQLILTKNKYNL